MIVGCSYDGWQITVCYLAILAIISLLAKSVSLKVSGEVQLADTVGFLCAPSLCFSSWRKRKILNQGARQRLLLRFLLAFTLLAGVYRLYIPEIEHLFWLGQAYLVVLPFWLFLETIDALCQLLWAPTGLLVPAINNRPWRAGSVSEFWGLRWNRLFGDWLYQVVFMKLRHKPQFAMFATFLVSGVLHEMLVSLPLQLVFERNVWGWATCYFLLQYLAIVFERSVNLPRVMQRVYVWLVVIVPAPLVLNPGTLLIFHFGG